MTVLKKIRVEDVYETLDDTLSVVALKVIAERAFDAEGSGEWVNLALDWAYDDPDYRRLVIKGERWETDAEYTKRLKLVEIEKKRREKEKKQLIENERKTYERLKRKFESAKERK